MKLCRCVPHPHFCEQVLQLISQTIKLDLVTVMTKSKVFAAPDALTLNRISMHTADFLLHRNALGFVPNDASQNTTPFLIHSIGIANYL